MTKENAIAIANKAISYGFVFDTHNDKNTKMDVDCILLVCDKEDNIWFPCWASRKHQYFSVNPIREKNGVLYLSGPVVDLRTKSLETAIEDMNAFYNAPSVNNGFSAFCFEIVEKRETGAFNADTGKRVESKNEFRDAFRKRKLVINL